MLLLHPVNRLSKNDKACSPEFLIQLLMFVSRLVLWIEISENNISYVSFSNYLYNTNAKHEYSFPLLPRLFFLNKQVLRTKGNNIKLKILKYKS